MKSEKSFSETCSVTAEGGQERAFFTWVRHAGCSPKNTMENTVCPPRGIQSTLVSPARHVLPEKMEVWCLPEPSLPVYCSGIPGMPFQGPTPPLRLSSRQKHHKIGSPSKIIL